MIALERIPVFGNLWRKRPQRAFLIALWKEVNGNLERYYVLEQRQFITQPFETEAWDEAQIFLNIKYPSALKDYAYGIARFNQALKEVKDFEGIYYSSIDKKTHENALILHSKQEALDEMLSGLKPKLLSAQKAMRSLLESK